MNIMSWRQINLRLLPRSVKIGLFALLVLLLAVRTTVTYLEPGEAGITWNPFTGAIELQPHAGIYVTPPWVFQTTIDVRPQRVCLTSSAHAAANCRLVQFDTRYYRDFIATEGWRWYWWSNRFSFNSGYHETYRGWRDVERGYAFAAQPYPFIHVLTEYR
jgi:hypothetical protein